MEDAIKQGIEWLAQNHSEISGGILGIGISMGLYVVYKIVKDSGNIESEFRDRAYKPVIRANYTRRGPHREYFDKQREISLRSF